MVVTSVGMTEETWDDEPEPELWEPYYQAPFTVAVKRFFQKYAVFHGRASRSEYWWWVFSATVVGIVLTGIMFLAGFAGASGNEPGPGFVVVYVLMLLIGLAVTVPSIAITVRRLHDANMSGWWYLLVLIPYAGALVIFIFTLLPPNPAGERFDR